MQDKLQELFQVVTKMNAAGGCVAEHATSPQDYLEYLEEETRELREAWGTENQNDELGDVFISALSLLLRVGPEPLQCAIDKLKRRRPHVFGDPEGKFQHLLPVRTVEDANNIWAYAKSLEKQGDK